MYRLILLTFIISSNAYIFDLWPLPKSITSGEGSVYVSPSFEFISDCSQSNVLDRALLRYVMLIPPSASFNETQFVLHKLHICVVEQGSVLNIDTKEDYTLSIPSLGVATLNATTVFGALRGLETFIQLMEATSSRIVPDTTTIIGTPITIQDEPTHPWRGLLIDTSRHYLKIETIQSIIDALSYAKMNVLHLHLTDSQSFPLIVPDWPLLSKNGAYSQSAVYSSQNLSNLVAYAKDRGVRVVTEFDTPAHASVIHAAYPDAVLDKCVLLDPSSRLTQPLIQSIVDVIRQYTDSDESYVHLGGDEVQYRCWPTQHHVYEWMTKHGIRTGEGVFQYFGNLTTSVARKSGFNNTIYWQDIVDAGVTLEAGSTVQVWLRGANFTKIASNGYKLILSATVGTSFYLDQSNPNPKTPHYAFFDNWKDFYLTDINVGLPVEYSSSVLGGEAAMWNEYSNDVSVQQQIWPRAAAIGEKFWSKYGQPINEVSDRLLSHSCRLLRRNIPTSAVGPNFCGYAGF